MHEYRTALLDSGGRRKRVIACDTIQQARERVNAYLDRNPKGGAVIERVRWEPVIVAAPGR